MTKFESKEELLKGVETHFNALNNGTLNVEMLENLVEKTRELYERALILRFKAYEEQVFGEVKEVLETSNFEQKEESEAIESVNKVIEEEENTTLEPTTFPENMEEQVITGNLDLPKAEPIFDFDIFGEEKEEDLVQEKTIETNFFSSEDLAKEPQNEVENLTTSISEESNALLEEQELVLENEDLQENLVDSYIEIEEKPIASEETFENETLVSESEENNITFSTTQNESFEQKEEEKLSEVISETNTETQSEIDLIFKNILTQDDSLASRFLSSKLDTLVGAFGFNERFQIAEELFNGSNDDFNQAITVLDNLSNFEEAKKQLLFYVHLNKWDLENATAIDFIQKIQRRFN